MERLTRRDREGYRVITIPGLWVGACALVGVNGVWILAGLGSGWGIEQALALGLCGLLLGLLSLLCAFPVAGFAMWLLGTFDWAFPAVLAGSFGLPDAGLPTLIWWIYSPLGLGLQLWIIWTVTVDRGALKLEVCEIEGRRGVDPLCSALGRGRRSARKISRSRAGASPGRGGGLPIDDPGGVEAKIISLRKRGLTYAEIQREAGVGRSKVYRTLKDAGLTGK
jgi:hypothetical protein